MAGGTRAVRGAQGARTALSRALLESTPGPVAWAGAGGAAHYRASGRMSRSLERIASWAEDEVDLLHLALGWRHSLRGADTDGPLTLVVEDLPPAFLSALERARMRSEDLLVILLDGDRRYVAETRSMWGRQGGSPGPYAEARGLSFAQPIEIDRHERLLRLLEGAVAERGIRFLHVLGSPVEEEAPPPRSSSREGYLPSTRPGAPSWPGPIESRPPRDLPDTMEAQALDRLAGDLMEHSEVVVFWARSASPGPLSLLGRRLRRSSVEGVLLEAAGAAAAGVHPLVAVSAPRLPHLLPELLEMAVFPLTLLVMGGGLTPMDESDEPHPAGMRDLSFLRHIPGVTIAVPADEEEARGVLHALLSLPGAGALRLASSPAVGVPDREEGPASLPPGTGRRLRAGGDLSLVCLGSTVFPAILASEALNSWGIQAGVYDLRYLEPLDDDLLAEAAACGRVLTVEEHCVHGGLGTAVLEALARTGRNDVRVHVLGIDPDIADSSPEEHGLSAEGIVEAARRMLGLGAGSEEGP